MKPPYCNDTKAIFFMSFEKVFLLYSSVSKNMGWSPDSLHSKPGSPLKSQLLSFPQPLLSLTQGQLQSLLCGLNELKHVKGLGHVWHVVSAPEMLGLINSVLPLNVGPPT